MEKPRRTRRRFTEEFKREAVRLLNESPNSALSTAKSLGVQREVLYRWRDELEALGTVAFRGNGNRTPEQERIRQLEAENRKLKMERDFLKKTAAYFAKDDE